MKKITALVLVVLMLLGTVMFTACDESMYEDLLRDILSGMEEETPESGSTGNEPNRTDDVLEGESETKKHSSLESIKDHFANKNTEERPTETQDKATETFPWYDETETSPWYDETDPWYDETDPWWHTETIRPSETINPGTQATVKDTDEEGQETYTSKVDPADLDFEGEQIVVLTREDEAYRREWGKAEDAIASDLGVIEWRIEVRNAKVMNDLNIDVVLYTSVTTTFDDYLVTMQQAVIEDVSTYSGQFDIVANFAYGAGYATLRGIQANLMDEDLFPYFDFTLPCWNQSIVKNVTLNDKLYVIFGDANLSAFDSANVIWCNKTLYDEYKASFGAPEDIQQHVLDGNWTWEDYQAWGDLFYEVGSGDATCSGVHGCSSDVWLADALVYAWDLELVTRTADNRFQYNVIGNDKAEEGLTRLRTFMSKAGVLDNSLAGAKKSCDCGNGYVSHFVNDETVFYVSILYSNASSDMITNMESEYFVMPMPKYEASQANYGTTSVDCYNLVSISNHSDLNGELLSAYLQYLNDDAYTKIRAHYIHKIVRGTFLATDNNTGMLQKSEKILDNILTNLEYDMATIYSNSLCDIMWMWRDIVRTEYDLETAFVNNNLSNGGQEKNQAMYEDAIEEFNAWIYDEAY